MYLHSFLLNIKFHIKLIREAFKRQNAQPWFLMEVIELPRIRVQTVTAKLVPRVIRFVQYYCNSHSM